MVILMKVHRHSPRSSASSFSSGSSPSQILMGDFLNKEVLGSKSDVLNEKIVLSKVLSLTYQPDVILSEPDILLCGGINKCRVLVPTKDSFKETNLLTAISEFNCISAMQFPSGRIGCVGGLVDGQISVWHKMTSSIGVVKQRPNEYLIGHPDSSVLCISVSPNNPYLFCSASLDLTIKFWDLRHKSAATSTIPFEHLSSCCKWSARDIIISVSGSVFGTNIETQQSVTFNAAESPVTSMALKDSHTFAVGYKGTLAKGLLRVFDERIPNGVSILQDRPTHKGSVISVKWCREDENYLATGGYGGVKVWDIRMNRIPAITKLNIDIQTPVSALEWYGCNLLVGDSRAISICSTNNAVGRVSRDRFLAYNAAEACRIEADVKGEEIDASAELQKFKVSKRNAKARRIASAVNGEVSGSAEESFKVSKRNADVNGEVSGSAEES